VSGSSQFFRCSIRRSPNVKLNLHEKGASVQWTTVTVKLSVALQVNLLTVGGEGGRPEGRGAFTALQDV
jgi:hypothetical protein